MIRLDIDHDAIERRKAVQRDLWEYRRVDHIPVVIWINDLFGHTYREFFESPDVHLHISVERIHKSLRLVPDDYIPFARLVRGPATVPSMFGSGVFWTDDPAEAPGTAGPVLADLEQVYRLSRPTMSDGLMPDHLRRIRQHAALLPPDVHLTGVFLGGPLQICADLVESKAFYAGFIENPQALHHLLDLVTGVQLEAYRAVAAAAGGIDRMTSIDYDPVWSPEPYKGSVCDDINAAIGTRQFRRFSIPYNNRLFAPYGSGLLHNCGPHPCAAAYSEHTPRIKGLNCDWEWSKGQLAELRQVFAGWGIIEFNFDWGQRPAEILAAFRAIMESLAPDVVGIPVCCIDERWADDEITAFYWDMRTIAEEYAANMRWAP